MDDLWRLLILLGLPIVAAALRRRGGRDVDGRSSHR
jgi:hypothetical protein